MNRLKTRPGANDPARPTRASLALPVKLVTLEEDAELRGLVERYEQLLCEWENLSHLALKALAVGRCPERRVAMSYVVREDVGTTRRRSLSGHQRLQAWERTAGSVSSAIGRSTGSTIDGSSSTSGPSNSGVRMISQIWVRPMKCAGVRRRGTITRRPPKRSGARSDTSERMKSVIPCRDREPGPSSARSMGPSCGAVTHHAFTMKCRASPRPHGTREKTPPIKRYWSAPNHLNGTV